MQKTIKFSIYALHPIMYQVPIFSALEERIKKQNLKLQSTVIFGDDLSLRNTFYEETNVVFRPDTPNLLQGYKHRFLKNLARDSRMGFFSRVNFGIVTHLIREKTDVLLIHGYESFSAWLALFAAKVLGVKVIWRGEVVPRESAPSMKNSLKKIILKVFFKRCEAVMYSCSGNKAYLKEYGVKESQFFPIPCAVDNDFFGGEFLKLKNQENKIRASLGIAEDDFVALFCARFTTRKRPMDLLEAMKRLKNEKMVALFVGDGPEKEKLMASAKESGLRAIFVGFKNQSEVSEFYSISDVAVVISSYDPSPKAMNEAMNFSLPIIVTDVVGTAHDLVMPNKNGFILKVGDIDGLVKSLGHLIDHPEIAQEMGRESQHIVSEWSYKRDVEGLLSAIESTIRPSGVTFTNTTFKTEAV